MANPQVEHWFRLADEDRDGGVGGAEAVRFFTKSGLPQEVLGQIWEYASGGGAKLSMGQFAVAMRLVALAQASGGRLLPDQARVVAMGGGPQLPPPRLAGVTDAPAPHIATYTPQITGLTPQQSSGGGVGYTQQPTGGYMPQVTGGYPQQQITGGMRPPSPYGAPPGAAAAAAGPTGTYTPQATGGYMPGVAGPTGGMPAAAAAAATAAGMTGVGVGGLAGGAGTLPGFPPVTLADMQRYQATFAAVDADRDGFAKGGECFPVFMKSGLDKGLLKRMWDLVAGNAGSLNAEQFFKCMYLMDGCRRGAALPAVLPPGPWPQVSMASPAAAGMTGPPGMMQQQQLSTGGARDSSSSGGMAAAMASLPGAAPLRADSWTLENQFGHKGAVKAISDAYDQTLPRIPELPGKINYSATVAAAAGPSTVPDLDATIANMLAPADKARWEAERAEALEKEKQEQAAEAEAVAAKARLEAFQTALSELVVYKSRINVALLQAGDSAARLAAEAEDTELRYNKARLAAADQQEEGNAARAKLQALLARKQEAANKLELLQQEIAMMANLNPAELAALEKEVGGLVAAMSAAEAKKAAMEMQLDSGKKQKGLLAERIADMELAAAAGEGDIRRARAELAELEAKLSSAQSAAQSTDLGEVGPLLGKAASAYRRLYSSAAAAGLEVPYEANLNNVGSLVWLEQLMAGTADWVDDDAALSGYTVVNALPDLEGVPPALLRAAALAAAQQPPIKPAAAAASASGEAAAATAKDAPAEAAELAEAAPAAAAAAAAEGASEKEPQAEALLAEKPQDAAPEAAAAAAAAADAPKDAGEGAVAAVASTAASAVSAVAAAGAAAVAAGAAAVGLGSKEASSEAANAEPDAEPAVADDAAAAAAVPAEPAAAAVAAASADSGFGDDAFGDSAFAPAGATVAAPEADLPTPVKPEASDAAVSAAAADEVDAEALAAQEAGAAEAAAELPASAVSAEPSQLTSPADAAAAAEGVGISIEPPVVYFADEDDSDIMSPMGHNLMSAVPAAAAAGDTGSSAAAGGTPVVIGGLAGFDPSMYRLNTEQRQLATQYSMDSSYAGSMAGGAAAGATGASSSNGFGDDAAFGESSTPGGEDGKTAGGLMGFEDNAF